MVMSTISSTAHLYPNVQIGEGADIGDFVVIGVPPRGRLPGELETVIGAGATIRSHTVIYAGNHIGSNFQSGHGAMLRECNDVGDDVSVGTNSVVEHHVTVESGVRIHSGAFVPEFSRLEAGCWIGPNVVLTNALHPLCPEAKHCLRGPVVERGAKIGANSTVLPDRRVGAGALVGAGSLVAHDVAPGAVVAGNPARPIKRIDDLDCPYGLIDHPYGGAASK
jgi:acetyltransferase-like isoleucine patch superfamily enzyme